MPTTVPLNAAWAIRWEVFAPGADGVAVPVQPTPPEPLPEDATDQQVTAYEQELARHAQRMSDWQAQVNALIADDDNWQITYSPQPDEQTAREQLALLNEVYAGSRQARNFTLVWSPPVEWTEVEA